tara:strand:- start:180 stop:620 length:441 start_codon:yes stop_codon:yes gene_type:complete
MEQLKFHTNKLRASGLRPTKQRLTISKILFNRKDTFHFTIEQLKKNIEKNVKKKISLATIYNTIHAFKKKGYLKEISLKGNQTFFDTNISNHHHFYDEDTLQLIDIKDDNISINNLPKIPSGKKIKEIEITIKVASNYQKQKKQLI